MPCVGFIDVQANPLFPNANFFVSMQSQNLNKSDFQHSQSMKFLLFSGLFFVLSATIFAQTDSIQVANRKNELGLDATGFIKYFSQISNNGFTETGPPLYLLTYRRYGKCGNFRAGIGGRLSDVQLPYEYSTTLEPILVSQISRALNARIGWEFYNELSSRWQVFYGMDFLGSVNYSRNDNTSNFGSYYLVGRESQGFSMGLAPVLGMRFRINKRICLTAESSLSVSYSRQKRTEYITDLPNPNVPPNRPTLRRWPDGKILETRYNQPLSIIFTFSI